MGMARRLGRILKHGLLGLAMVVGGIALVRQGVVPLVDAAFGPGAATLSLVRRSGILVVVLLAYLAWRRWVLPGTERDLQPRPLWILAGGLGGAVQVSIATLVGFALGYYVVLSAPGGSPALIGVAGMILVAAFLEEVIYRGVLMSSVEAGLGTTLAIWLQAVVFAAMHLSNAPASPAQLLTTMVAGTLLGALWAALYVWTRNLWVVTAHHACWNFAIILTGLPLSGIEDWRALAPFESGYNGPPWLTGGVFGPEDSPVCMVLVVLGLVLFIRLAKRRGRWRPMPRSQEPSPSGRETGTV